MPKRNANPLPPDFKAGETSFKRMMPIDSVDHEKRTIALAFSSDVELKRYPGFVEKLDHSAGACDLTRLNSGANLLFNHNWDDYRGVIESAEISSDGKGRALVRFGNSKAADEAWQDVRDGILRNVSVGYIIEEIKLKETREGGDDVYVVTKWTPYEISLVTVPADISVGVGRSLTNSKEKQKPTRMNEAQMRALLAKRGVTIPDDADIDALTRLVVESEPAKISVGEERTKAANAERERSASIMAIGKKIRSVEMAEKAVADGVPLDQFRAMALDEIGKRDAAFERENKPLGLNDKEARSFSFHRLIRAAVDPQDKKAQKEAGFELDICRNAADARGKESKGIYIPVDVLRTPLIDPHTKRAIISVGSITSTGTATVDETVANNLLVSSFWEILRNRTTALRLGRTLGGLVGNYDVPYQSSAATAAWLAAEDNAATQTDVNFSHKSLTPKTLATFAEITRKSLVQSSIDVEAFTRLDLIRGMQQALDVAFFYGTGSSGQPTGIKATSGIQSIDFTGASPTWSELVSMETEIEADNVDANSGRYVFNARMRGYLKTTLKTSGIAGYILEGNGGVNGYGTEVTNQITTGDVFFGDFSEVVIGQWGGLDLIVDPYTHSTRGRIRIVNFQDWDFMVRRPEALAYGAQQTP